MVVPVDEPVELEEDNNVDDQLEDYDMDDQLDEDEMDDQLDEDDNDDQLEEHQIDDQLDEDDIDDQFEEYEIDDPIEFGPEPPSPRTILGSMVRLGIEDAIGEALVIDANSLVLDANSIVLDAYSLMVSITELMSLYTKMDIQLSILLLCMVIWNASRYLWGGANLEVAVDGVSPLHSACSDNGFDDMALLLIRSANDPERVTRMLAAVDKNGDTPLHYAARFDQTSIVTALLDSGATPTLTNNIGRTPFDLAVPNTEAWRILQDAAQDNN